MPTTEDRLNALKAQDTAFTGIEFVQIVDPCLETTLRVFFLTDPRRLVPPFEPVSGSPAPVPLTPGDIRIYSPSGAAPDIEVTTCGASNLEWSVDPTTNRVFLEICVEKPGDFTDYRLLIDDPNPAGSRLDDSFNDVPFSFKVGCDTGLDCAPPALECPEGPKVDFPVDYLARDFVSLRNALLDFAAQSFPDWTFPIEADVGVMLAEIMAALGDELSYVQDRYNREAYLPTATERRSLRKKARLVDHDIHDGRLATTFFDLTLSPGGPVTINTGGVKERAWALSEGAEPIAFEIGHGLRDTSTFFVRPEWNAGELEPYLFDDDQNCLDVGATELFVKNDPLDRAIEPVDFDEWVGRSLLLATNPADPSRPARRLVVTVVDVTEVVDRLFNVTTARIRWRDEDALPFQLCQSELILSGNVVPATAGETRTARVRIGALDTGDDPSTFRTVEREGPLEVDGTRSVVHLASLPDTDQDGLAFLDDDGDLRSTIPEILLRKILGPTQPPPPPPTPPLLLGEPYTFRRSLLIDGADDTTFTLEDGTWRRIVAYDRVGGPVVHRDYATQAGYTIRFGDGRFGALPEPGDLFQLDYRLGAGVRANVAADTITAFSVPGHPRNMNARVQAVTNPLAVTNGVDPESAADIKLLTPEAYQAETLFAVRPEDYGEQAEKLDFVQRAQGALRWTGSWHSVVASIDPFGRFTIDDEERTALTDLFECVRQAGREVIVADPRFVSLDLVIRLCIEPFAVGGQVRAQVIERLFGRRGLRPLQGFFDPDRFTFGTPLRRSALEAVIHDVRGVRAVLGMDIRPIGVTPFRPFNELIFEVDPDQIIRLENNPLLPERGSLRIETEGGA